MDPCESLCYFDKRNPNGIALPDDDDPEPRELGCACDNCFYGRDKLAMEIIRLRSVVEGFYKHPHTPELEKAHQFGRPTVP